MKAEAGRCGGVFHVDHETDFFIQYYFLSVLLLWPKESALLSTRTDRLGIAFGF